jgi:endonuclease/exonuclease/phosphatase family metal-dependent hydrolase
MSLQQAVITKWLQVTRRSLNREDTEGTNIDVGNKIVNEESKNISSVINTTKQQQQNTTNQFQKKFNHPKINLKHNLQQQLIDQQPQDRVKNEESWGDDIQSKAEGTMRIACRNINFLPKYKGQVKNDELINDISALSIDLFGLCEANLAWHNMVEQDQPRERFRGYLEKSKFVIGNNTTDKSYKETIQMGGTMIIGANDIVHRIQESGSDQHKLGRWTWFKLQGQQGMQLRIVMVYRPVYSVGMLSTYQQQKQYLLSNDIDTCPRQMFFHHLQEELQKWYDDGERIIIMGDFNEDIRSKNIKSFFSQFGMKDIIIQKHGITAPNTYANGTVPIDGVFATMDIIPILCGYSAIGWGTSCDHRLLWADFDIAAILGHQMNPLWTPSIRRLKLVDPRLVSRFLQLRRSHIEEHKLAIRLQLLYHGIQNESLTAEQQHEYESIDQIRVEGILHAERHCRKLKMGKVPWSPKLQEIINNIRYLRACQK